MSERHFGGAGRDEKRKKILFCGDGRDGKQKMAHLSVFFSVRDVV